MSASIGLKFTVARRLLLAFASVIVTFLVVASISLWSASKLEQADGWNTHTYKVLASADDMLKSMLNMETGARGFMLAGEESFLEPWNTGKAGFERAWREARTLTADNAEQQRRLEQIKTQHDAFAAAAGAYIQLGRDVKSGKGTLASMQAEFAKGKDKAAMDAFRALEADFAKAEQALLVVRAAASEVQRAFNRTSIVVGSLLAVAVAVLMGAWVTTSITRPLQQAVRVAEQVAQGDLTVTVQSHANDEAGQLLRALGAMAHSLVAIVGQVRRSSDSIAIGSTQIASGNTDLSQRTEEQASSLQQTAASMEQMSQAIRDSANTAQTATQMAGRAREAAEEGGRIVGQVVDTMEEIAESSRRISDILGVIDGIAFQTNILALNAAVEAARAGEQGRGFAVVAGEVRTLAQRSGDAAKEIKTLIEKSSEKVEAGSRLVGDAGTAMSEIVDQVKKVDDLIAEIGAASKEQSQSIAQVNGAMGQLDEMTQQNAALVEESSAASVSLQRQAEELARVVNTFKLADRAGHRSPDTGSEEPLEPHRGRGVAQPVRRKPTAVPEQRQAQPEVAVARKPEEDWATF